MTPLAAFAFARHLGLPALAALVGAESMGLPVPGETALIAAAVLAHQGHLAIGSVIAVVACAAIVGDNIGYLIGRRGGRWLLERPGPLLARRRRLLERGDRFFERHGPKAVFLARFVAGARVTAAWMAGDQPHALANLPGLERARRGHLGGDDRAARLLPRSGR